MALWGSRDGVALTGTASIANANTTLEGANTEFTDELSIGSVIALDDGQRFRVVGITDDDTAVVSPKATAAEDDSTIKISDTPTFVDPRANVSLKTTDDLDANSRAIGVKTPGWTSYRTWGSGRKQAETLVAFKGQQS